MRARPSSSPAAAVAITTCLLASVLPLLPTKVDARWHGSNVGILRPRASVPSSINSIKSHSNSVKANGSGGVCSGAGPSSAAASCTVGGGISSQHAHSSTMKESASDQRWEDVLAIRGGGLFGGRRKEETSNADDDVDGDGDNNEDGDDEGDLYPLMDDAAEEALASNNEEDSGANADSSGMEIDMSSSDGPSRTVEVQAKARHLFSRDPDIPKKSLLSRLFPTSPIHPTERSTFFALSTMMFLFIYTFTTVRDTKDALVVSHCGAESIPFLKLYGVLPSAVLFILGYTKASNLLGKEALFYVTLVPFFLFYSLFAYVLYPNREAIHFPKLGGVQSVADAAPGPLSLIRYWSFSLYFIVSELWASAGVPLLFWQVSLITSF